MPFFPLGASNGSLTHFRLVALWIQFCDGLNWSCFFALCPVLFLLLVHKWMSFQHCLWAKNRSWNIIYYYYYIPLLIFILINFIHFFFLINYIIFLIVISCLIFSDFAYLAGSFCWLYLPQFLLIFHF